MSLSITVSITGSQVGSVNGIPFTPGMNVQQAMEAAYAVSHEPVVSFSLEYFGQTLGYEVVELDGITNQVGANSATYLFWGLSINGAFAQTGIDSTYPNDGDEIEWNYTVYNATTHGGTRHEHIRDALATLRAKP